MHDNPAMGPDWFGNPQHFVGAFVIAFVVAQVAGAWLRPWWARAALAVGAAATAEIVWELVEYVLLYRDDASVEEYYDTLADLASSVIGGVAGAGASAAVRQRRS